MHWVFFFLLYAKFANAIMRGIVAQLVRALVNIYILPGIDGSNPSYSSFIFGDSRERRIV